MTIDIVKDFCDYRILKYNERYEYLVSEGTENLKIIQAKIKFIQMIIDGRLDFKNKNRKAIKKDLTIHFEASIIDYMLTGYFFLHIYLHLLINYWM